MSVLFLIGCVVLTIFLFRNMPENPSVAEDRRKGFHCLREWDGSHHAFNRAVSQRLRDPESFQHIETRVTPRSTDGTHRIRVEYRARNGFGGMTAGLATGTYRNADCNAVTVLTIN